MNYKIQVSLNDVKHTLSAFETIRYTNNSPDTLNELWFHLWPNAYRNANTALAKQKLQNKQTDFLTAKDKDLGFIDSLDFKTNNIRLSWRFDDNHIDICRIKLLQPLTPGSTVEITTPFFVKIPNASISRLGHSGQFYAISQWYPKPAVYDRKGWHAIPYLDQGEFYSEFGSFEVTITLPENYVIGATGELENGEKELAWLTEKSKEEIILKKDMKFPDSSPTTKTLTYKQSRIHDFAFFADKRYHVRKGEATLASGKKITTWAFFTNNEAELWLKGVDYINQGINDYSEWIGDYPYSSCTAIDGTISAGGGMEYPMITIIGTSGTAFTLETTIVHEVGHNWFYGILGSNERLHPWMDEGINSYYETRSLMRAHPSMPAGNNNELSGLGKAGILLHTDRIDARKCNRFMYQLPASGNTDQAISIPASDFTYLNTAFIVYKKTSAAFSYLENYLGATVFDRSMHAYFNEWNFRHPYPEDLQKVFETTSGKNLDWFFNDLFTTTKKQDVRICGISKDGNNPHLKIYTGDTQWPFPVSALKNDSVISTNWIEPKQSKDTYTIPCDNCDEIIIDYTDVTLDVNNINNNIRTHGLLKKSSPYQLKFLAGIPVNSKKQVFYSPIVGWNNYNKLMAGIVVHNTSLPQRKFEYVLAPMYGFNDKELVGMGKIDYHFLPQSQLFRDITLSIGARRFAYDERSYKNSEGIEVPEHFHYLRLNPSLRFDFLEKLPRLQHSHYIEISSLHLSTDEINYNQLQNGTSYGEMRSSSIDLFRLQYGFSNNRLLDPWSVRARFEGAEGLTKTDITLRYKISYKNAKRGVDMRLFAGVTWKDQLDGFYNYSLSDRSTAGGDNDYAYDNLYFGRSQTDGFLSKQIALRDGAFKSMNPLGSFRTRLISFNIEADFPGKLPFRFFGDLATYNDFSSTIDKVYGFKQSFTYDAGICLSLAKEVVVIYLPLLRSKEIKEYEKQNNLKLADQIRFVFDISKMNPLNLRKMIIP